MSISRREFVISSTLASLAAASCTREKEATPRSAARPALGSTPTTILAAYPNPATGIMRVDFIGLMAFVYPGDYSWADVALVKANEAPGLTSHFHIPTLRVARTAINYDKTTLPVGGVDEDFVNFRLDNAVVRFASVNASEQREDLKAKFSIGHLGGLANEDPDSKGCPKIKEEIDDRDPWTDIDWVLAATDIYPGLEMLPKAWKDQNKVSTRIELRAGKLEDDDALIPDDGKSIYRWVVQNKKGEKVERALKEVVRHTVTNNAGAIGIDIVVDQPGKSYSVRCDLKNGAYVQLVHMPVMGMPNPDRTLDDLKALYWLTDDKSGAAREAELYKCLVPTTKDIVTKTCRDEATSDCGCCPPMRFKV